MASTEDDIKQQLKDNPVILYMKGTPELPRCGFSARAVLMLQRTGVPFTSVDVLANPKIREVLPKVSQWPTFPQLFVRGDLVGGCDIIVDMANQGELQKLLASASS
ncbi:MAG: Grx4 family monothiol glutaredoxin [Polyangiales bacterium]